MFDTIADMLRGSAPDDLAYALGTDRTQTRRAMEIGLPALITGLRDKTLEPGGAQNLAAMLDDPNSAVPDDVGQYLSAGDPSRGAAMLDVAFGDRGEPALASLSSASGLSTRLLAQVMSVLAPLATGTVGSAADRSPDGLRDYLGAAVTDLQDKGFGRVVDLVSPSATGVVTTDLDGDDALLLGSSGADAGGTVVEGVFPDMDEPGSSPAIGLGAAGAAGAAAVAGAAGVAGLGGSADLDLPDVDLPDVDLPDMDMPDVEVPDIATPSMPDLDLTASGLPKLEAPDFSADIAPASATIARPGNNFGTDAGAPTIALADAPKDLDTGLTGDVDADVDLELEGSGLSGMGWLWWVLGAVLGLVVLLFALSRCGGSDGDGDSAQATDVTTEVTPEAAAEPTPDPAVLARQADLDAILVEYPNVNGEVIGEVAVLNGTVGNETERALLDQAVRATGLGVQNNVTSTEAAPSVDFSLNDIVNAQPELTTLRALLDEAGLGEALDSGADFTLFAPTNDAFAAVADELAELRSDPQALQDVLRYHLLVGAQDSGSLIAAGTVPTELGEDITIALNGDAVVVNGNSQVLAPDAPARNGVLHIVSAVLLPNIATPLPEEIGAELNLQPITFTIGSSDITAAGQVELDKVVAFLTENPGNVQVGGHTDSDGDPGFNQTLSQDRADAVVAYLVANGVPAESLSAAGFGADQPIVANDTPENKALNRRIEFRPN